MKYAFLFLLVILFLTSCDDRQNEINQLTTNIDSLHSENQVLSKKLNQIAWERDQYRNIVRQIDQRTNENQNVSYCFVRFKYETDTESGLQASASDIHTVNNLDVNKKALFMDSMYKRLEEKTIGKVYIRNREFFSYKSYAEASESHMKNDGMTVKELIDGGN